VQLTVKINASSMENLIKQFAEVNIRDDSEPILALFHIILSGSNIDIAGQHSFKYYINQLKNVSASFI